MHKKNGIEEYVRSLISSKRLGSQVVHHTVLPELPPFFSKPEKPWPKEIDHIIKSAGIHDLYRHQVDAVDRIRSDRHLVVATPTASGKTLIYNLPVIEKVLKNPDSKALYIFPLKALAQDQLRTFQELSAHGKMVTPTIEIYDGDTSAWHRKRIRETPPNILLTNPEMVHLSLLPHHLKWAEFFGALDTVVVDEVHTYRGIMGSHMAQVFRRLRRICSFYGAAPKFVFCSATVSNPTQLAEQLTGLTVDTITESGAPLGEKHIVFINPAQGPAQTAILLLKAALHRGLRTIVYTQSRKLTELIAIWAGSQSGPFASRISAYRAGFLPEERREIEARLAKGDLLAVISTSALELGIDIGDLDLCLLVGYPGTVVATWQRGGRVGRSGQKSALVLIAGEDALDQYFMRNPEDFLDREPEAAVVNPYNPEITSKHIICAAAELPIKSDEPWMSHEHVKTAVLSLEAKGDLLRSEDGTEIYSSRQAPHRHINLRGTGDRFNIVSNKTGRSKGEIDGFRAFRETHPGAIYLHKGDTFLVDILDLDTRTVKVSKAHVDYYTRVRSEKNTEILNIYDQKNILDTIVYAGKLKVTDKVLGYEKWRIHAKKRLSVIPLDLPEQIFETDGLWFKIPSRIQKKAEAKYFHFMGGIHAIEHAAIGIFPLLVMADRNDLGGISTPFHPQVGSAAVFIYDGVPGGAGLSLQAFKRARDLLEYTFELIRACPCESGCPSCVHSPKCGSGNRPIDKAAAGFLLEEIIKDRDSKSMREVRFDDPLRKDESGSDKTCSTFHGTEIPKDMEKRSPNFKGRFRKRSAARRKQTKVERRTFQESGHPIAEHDIHFCVFDVETQRSAQEVGGWHRADLMGISCVVLYDSKEDTYFEFLDDQISQLVEHLKDCDLVVGFNIKKFDFHVLGGYSDFSFGNLPVLDILEDVHQRLGYRLSLDHLAGVTLGKKKTADGLQALRWWKQGRMREIIDYCKADVEITRDLYWYGKKNGYLLFTNKAQKTVRIPVKW
ncbi:MAG TPA: DEAD/DEAH box helicase [Desulfobacterales bacterium]|nr:DEAD/DEAH box helicase [Desulfobacterales bacterium]